MSSYIVVSNSKSPKHGFVLAANIFVCLWFFWISDLQKVLAKKSIESVAAQEIWFLGLQAWSKGNDMHKTKQKQTERSAMNNVKAGRWKQLWTNGSWRKFSKTKANRNLNSQTKRNKTPEQTNARNQTPFIKTKHLSDKNRGEKKWNASWNVCQM